MPIVSFRSESVVRAIMLTDRYGLLLSTTSPAAWDAYVGSCEAKLRLYPGAIEAFDRGIAADPTGHHLVVANYIGGDFVIVPMEADGRLGTVSGR
jgi:hypothetical protein